MQRGWAQYGENETHEAEEPSTKHNYITHTHQNSPRHMTLEMGIPHGNNISTPGDRGMRARL